MVFKNLWQKYLTEQAILQFNKNFIVSYISSLKL